MQGHIFMAQCAAEQTRDPRLKALLAAHPKSLVNGAFFPDSGYTAADHDQGEIAHWEQYVDGYIQLVRERHKTPSSAPEAAPHIAFMMGIGAHGITDSTFDTLLYARSEQVDRANMDPFDMAMDIFLVADMPRYFLPEYAFDAATLSLVYDRVPHKVPAANITKAMEIARSGIGAVTTFLHTSADTYGKMFPWARSHLRDSRTPGAYPFGARVVARYYEEIFRRLEGDTSADKVLIGSYPDPEYPLLTLDPKRADGQVVLFFGHGLDRATINGNTFVLRDGAGGVVPSKVSIFRGDKWPNVITLRPDASWLPDTKYVVTVTRGLRTLNGTSPSSDIQLSFQTCTPVSPGGDCAEPPAPAPGPSPCPVTENQYKKRPGTEEPPPEPAPSPPPSAAAPSAPQSSSCAASPRLGHDPASALAALLVLPFALGARRLRREVDAHRR